MSEEASSSEPTQDFPIVTYSNRIQHRFDYISGIMSQTDDLLYIVRPLRILLRNFPPKGKEALKEEIKKVIDYDVNSNAIGGILGAEEIYNKAHDWFYDNILQDAFRFRPKNPRQAHIGSGTGGMKKD